MDICQMFQSRVVSSVQQNMFYKFGFSQNLNYFQYLLKGCPYHNPIMLNCLDKQKMEMVILLSQHSLPYTVNYGLFDIFIRGVWGLFKIW